ncbi:MAG: hypothetical protein ACREFI_14405, partial [Stellaceae bacterium]
MAFSSKCWAVFQAGRPTLLVGAPVLALIAIAALAIWHLREDALGRSQQEVRRLGIVLSEQTSRSMQAIDLTLQDIQGRIASAGISSEQQFRDELGTEEIHRLLVDRLGHLPQAEALTLVDA